MMMWLLMMTVDAVADDDAVATDCAIAANVAFAADCKKLLLVIAIMTKLIRNKRVAQSLFSIIR